MKLHKDSSRFLSLGAPCDKTKVEPTGDGFIWKYWPSSINLKV